MEVGEEVYYYYTYRYTVTTRMTPRSCIKVGNDESHFNVSLIVRDKVTIKTGSTRTPQPFSKRKENRSGIEPRLFCLPETVNYGSN